jgi:hypothetical protein
MRMQSGTAQIVTHPSEKQVGREYMIVGDHELHGPKATKQMGYDKQALSRELSGDARFLDSAAA